LLKTEEMTGSHRLRRFALKWWIPSPLEFSRYFNKIKLLS